MDVLEAQRVWQANHIHIQAGQTTSEHETTRKKPKTNKFAGVKEAVKNEKERKQREKKRKREQEDRKHGRSVGWAFDWT